MCLLFINLIIVLPQISPRYDRSLTALTEPRKIVGKMFYYMHKWMTVVFLFELNTKES